MLFFSPKNPYSALKQSKYSINKFFIVRSPEKECEVANRDKYENCLFITKRTKILMMVHKSYAFVGPWVSHEQPSNSKTCDLIRNVVRVV